MIDTQTKLMALLGKPLGQSYSAAMHAAAFESLGLNCLYLPIESEADALGDIIAGIRRMNFVGFNVTKPYKVEIMRYLDGVDDLAALVGAVNTVKKDGGRLIGYNTDGAGFVDSLRQEMGFAAKGGSFFLIGAGGAARSVALALAQEGAASVALSDLYPDTARELAAHINANIKNIARFVESTPKGLRQAAAGCECIINASGVGMYPHPERTPLEKELLRPGQIVCDLTYNPAKTRLLQDAAERGCKVLNGLGMLIGQGVRAFEIWLDQKAPADVMRRAVLDRLNAE